MRRALCGMDTSDISRYFPSLLKIILKDCNGDYSNIVELFKKNLVNNNKGNSQEMPDNKRLRDRIQNANMYNLRAWVNLFFRKLESENNSAPVDFSRLSIEHLMPQTATQDWFDALSTDKETYENNIHRLGNLTLAARSDNSKMSNRLWDYKNKILSSTSHLKMNQEILQKRQWTLRDIEDRTQQLIVEIARLYPYYEAKDSVVNKLTIHIDFQNGSALAYYYPDNGNVEVLKGTTLYMEFQTPESYPEIEALRTDFKENEIIFDDNGILTFAEDYFFNSKRVNSSALSTAASFILHGSRNGWDCWKTEEGIPLSQLEGLRKDHD